MDSMFKYKIYLPSKERYFYFKPLTNSIYADLNKIVANNDDQLLCKAFASIIYHLSERRVNPKKITRVDSFCIMLNIFIVSVRSTLELKLSDNVTNDRAKLDLYDVLDRVTNFQFEYEQEVDVNEHMSVVLKPPSVLYLERDNMLLEECVKQLTVNNNKYNFLELNDDQKRTVIDAVPAEFMTHVVNNIIDINQEYNIEIYRPPGEDSEGVVLNMYNNSMFEILKIMFAGSLEATYFYKYFFAKHMGISNIDDMTPAETETYINFFKQEQEQAAKAQKDAQKKSNRGTHLGGEIPGGLPS